MRTSDWQITFILKIILTLLFFSFDNIKELILCVTYIIKAFTTQFLTNVTLMNRKNG